MPVVMVLLIGLTIYLPRWTKRSVKTEVFDSTYHYVMVLVAGLMLAIHVMILQATAGQMLDMGRWMLTILFLFFALTGNVMGKLQPNPYMGIRTPWTLGNESVWRKTHEKAGQIWRWGGALGTVACLLGMPLGLCLTLLLVLTLWPILLSYVIHRKLNL